MFSNANLEHGGVEQSDTFVESGIVQGGSVELQFSRLKVCSNCQLQMNQTCSQHSKLELTVNIQLIAACFILTQLTLKTF